VKTTKCSIRRHSRKKERTGFKKKEELWWDGGKALTSKGSPRRDSGRFTSDQFQPHIYRDANAFPSPRSWEFVSRILDSLDSQAKPAIEHEVIAGAVGTGAATEFSAFLRMFRELPNIDAILLNPTQEPVPENAAAQYAVASALARCASDTNFDRICLYLNRLPTEFRVLCVRDATLREPAIRCTAGYTKWAVENHHAIA
jgi:hypothetical protein